MPNRPTPAYVPLAGDVTPDGPPLPAARARGIRIFADTGERSVSVPDYVGQLAALTRDSSLAVAVGTSPGAWSPVLPLADTGDVAVGVQANAGGTGSRAVVGLTNNLLHNFSMYITGSGADPFGIVSPDAAGLIADGVSTLTILVTTGAYVQLGANNGSGARISVRVGGNGLVLVPLDLASIASPEDGLIVKATDGNFYGFDGISGTWKQLNN